MYHYYLPFAKEPEGLKEAKGSHNQGEVEKRNGPQGFELLTYAENKDHFLICSSVRLCYKIEYFLKGKK